MTPYQQAMLALARRFYPKSLGYDTATDEQLLRWLSEDAAKAARKAAQRDAQAAR